MFQRKSTGHIKYLWRRYQNDVFEVFQCLELKKYTEVSAYTKLVYGPNSTSTKFGLTRHSSMRNIDLDNVPCRAHTKMYSGGRVHQ